MNRRGMLRIVEAVVAILIVISFLLIISSRRDFSSGSGIEDELPSFLDEVAKNDSLRESVINSEPGAVDEIEQFLLERIDSSVFNFSVKICGLDDLCFLDNYPQNFQGEIYSNERVVSSSLGNDSYVPKKVKIFLWRNG